MVRLPGLGIGYAAMMWILSAAAARQPPGNGADIGLIVLLMLAAGVLAALWGAVDGARWARLGLSREVGRWTWGVAICVFAVATRIANAVTALSSEPVAGRSLDVVLYLLLDALVVVPGIAGFLCVAVVGSFGFVFTRVDRGRGRAD
ncbi:hypothetical protein GTR02_12635 [Kineococcus sp. R8]|uniref:hypothetical protein n=1 Tax=Kineococcus siccus TaxID=2696567 RepID=UPI001412EBCE|nr:hypothetical protein [Kineococcus siccus]NAZ82666.1 hypothetical protein [Kineococcus siccus]